MVGHTDIKTTMNYIRIDKEGLTEEVRARDSIRCAPNKNISKKVNLVPN